MRRRKLILSITSVIGVTALAACTSSGSSSTSARPSASSSANSAIRALLPGSVKAAGKLTVASDVSYPPFEFFAPDNKTVIGADADLAHALGGVLGVTFELHNTPFDGIVAALAAHKFDIAVSGMADTAQRRQQVSFVDYAANGLAFLDNAADASTYTSFASLCGRKAAVQSGTTMADDLHTASRRCRASGKSAITISSYQTQDQIVLALHSGRSDVAVSTGGSAAYIVSQSSGQFAAVRPSDPVRPNVPLGIVVPKDQPQLAKVLQQALKILIENGTYHSIMKKWNLAECCSNKSGTINGA